MSEKMPISNNCLNCGTLLQGNYCHVCGQERIEHKESLLHLVQHFFEDITHYDGKFWATYKPLLLKPGFLTQQYQLGRRASYLNPVRMFIFLNFLLFLVYFSLPEGALVSNNVKGRRTSLSEITAIAKDSIKKHLNEAEDSIKASQLNAGVDSLAKVKDFNINFGTDSDKITSPEAYYEQQARLPSDKKDGYVTKWFKVRGLAANKMFKDNPKQFATNVVEVFNHNLPKINFVFLLFAAIFLTLLYSRSQYYFVDHAIFSIHITCTFIALTIIMMLVAWVPYVGDTLVLITFLYGNYYFYKSLRKVYQQGRLKTIIKFFVLNLLLFVVIATSFIINVLMSALLVPHEV